MTANHRKLCTSHFDWEDGAFPSLPQEDAEVVAALVTTAGPQWHSTALHEHRLPKSVANSSGTSPSSKRLRSSILPTTDADDLKSVGSRRSVEENVLGRCPDGVWNTKAGSLAKETSSKLTQEIWGPFLAGVYYVFDRAVPPLVVLIHHPNIFDSTMRASNKVIKSLMDVTGFHPRR
ncbi:hypothetical protein BDN67DRAFT_1011076 [Paxillus ammoniavirescens]|nr:hypothetical protein BDN67DRAFT_1011076 [Paxillus ammoniavirescens]